MNRTSRTLLIVDDSPEDQELYRRYLQRDREYSYTILEAALGQQGLELWHQHQPDAVLLDYRLPDLDGLEFLAQLTSSSAQRCFPVIVVTGQGNEAIAVQAMKAGAQDYLVKEQLSAETLRVALNSTITNVQLRQQLQQSEAALRESEERLRSALAASRMGTWDWNFQTGLIQWSDNLEALFGLKPGEFDGSFEMFAARLHPDDRDRVLSTIERAIATAADYDIEFRVVFPDGKVRWALTQGKVFYDANGQPIRMAGVDIDITERKRSEQSLQESEERFRTSVENMLDCFGIYSALRDEQGQIIDFRIDYVNDAVCLVNDMPREEQIGQGLCAILPGHHDSGLFEEYCQVVETGQPLVKENLVYEDEFGQQRLVKAFDIRAAKLGDAFVATWRDITARKQVEEALRKNEQLLRLALTGAHAGSWDWEIPSNKIVWSPENYDLYGLEPAHGLPRYEDWLNALHPDDREQASAEVLRVVEQQLPELYCEFRIIHPQQGIRWLLGIGRLILDEQGQPVRLSGINLDITDRKQAEVERDRLLAQEQAARAEAERANRVKDEFLAILSHELRSPLNPILGWAKLLQTRKFNETKTAEALATIERNAKLQTQLVDDLLDIAKILRGKLSMDTAPVDLVFVIESAIDTVRTAAVAKSILIHPVLPPVGTVAGDAARLQQIVWNLLSNAIKFTPAGGRVEVRLERIDHQIQIVVRDTGRGINPSFLPHLFETFRQEDVSTARQYGGLGLGLAIVRSLVEAHGGTIAADSPGQGQGATFTVKLPLLNADSEKQPIDHRLQPEFSLSGIRVLAVDDEPDARDLLAALLTQYGAEVLTVASAAAAMAGLETFRPDVLVSDIGMPEVDGYSLIQQIRALPPDQGGQIPAIALTAYAREVDRQRTLASGYQHHINKPFEPEWLVQAVLALVNKTHISS